MPYRITRHADDLIWVLVEGHLSLDHADAYLHELWATLDSCRRPTDLLVDGRSVGSASSGARRRTEQVLHHPHLGHLAFVVGEAHMLLFAPLVKLVSGIGLFRDDVEALAYLRAARGLPAATDGELAALAPAPLAHAGPDDPAGAARAALVGPPGRSLPPPPMSRVPARLHRASSGPGAPPAPPAHHLPPPPAPRHSPAGADMAEGWAAERRSGGKGIEGD